LYVILQDIAAEALMAGLSSAKDVPYFDGDFWPNTLEEAIAEEEREKNIEESIDSNSAQLEVRFTVFITCCLSVSE